MSAEIEAELDADVEQDEILAKSGMYNVAPLPGTGGRFLVGIGIVMTLVGVLLELMVAGYVFPIPDSFPTPLGSALVLAVGIAGGVCLVAGLVRLAMDRRNPDELRPIV